MDIDTQRELSAEVDALMRLHAMAFREACQLAGVKPSYYLCGVPPIEWVPLPSQIHSLAMAIRREEVRVYSREHASPRRERARQAIRDFDLACELPDDRIGLPAWFRDVQPD